MSLRLPRTTASLAAFFIGLAIPAVAAAQSFPFERTIAVSGDVALDVLTERGKIDIAPGDSGRIVITGTATVRAGWNVPADAVELARASAAQPNVEETPHAIRLRPPVDERTRQAVTVAYQIRVPPATRVNAASDSGAITIEGIQQTVVVRTQSGAIELSNLDAALDVASGSGAVTMQDLRGDVRVETTSSAILARGLGAGFRARTGSGAIEATFSGRGDADVLTRSSRIALSDLQGALTARTNSGHVDMSGVPGGPWDVDSGSGSQEIRWTAPVRATLDASSGSGSVIVSKDLLAVDASDKRRVRGEIGDGGAGGGVRVTLRSRSGSIKIEQSRR